MKRSIALVLVLVVALVVGGSGCTRRNPAFQGGPSRVFQPGAEGIGDPYFPTAGNGGYDVASYDLTLRYDPATDQLTGRAKINAVATADLSRFNLDYRGPAIEAVAVDEAPAPHTREGDELVVTPNAGIVNGRQFTVDVRYSGVPSAPDSAGLGARGWLHTSDGALALGEPESASAWFPVNEHPQDKATYTIAVTVPDGLAALSNGVPLGTSTQDGWTTWKWAERAPMASYLATVAIGRYRVTSGTHGGKPIVTAVSADIPPGDADQAMARTGEIADFLATRFGPYPFEALGGIVHNESRVGFALENQGRPLYSANFFRSTRSRADGGTWVVAHELAHQWFGDSISIYHWADVWLNEGFATYAEWLWSEHIGQATAQQSFDRVYDAANDQSWQVPPADPGPDMFRRGSWAIYNRGGMTLHALRRSVGDDPFFRILKTWTAEKRYRNATTEEFITLAERVSGRQLRPLFHAWLVQPTRPPRP